MGINLSFDSTATEAELKAVRAYINARLGDEADEADEDEVTTEAINDAPPAPARRKPARRKPGPKPKTTPAPAPEPEAEADEADEDDEDDVMGDSGGFTVDDVKSKAKELVGEGKTADVRKALQAVGKNRVSEIATNAEAAAFMKALG